MQLISRSRAGEWPTTSFPASLDTSDEWIRSHTGIGYRHIADPSVASSDLAYEACRKVLEKTAIAAEEIDLVLVATATPDFIGFPSVSCIVQDRLGAKNAGAMDLAAGCTGFIYALETARGFVVSGGARKVLVAGADVLSRIANWQDRNTCVLFGDGAGAALVSADAVTRGARNHPIRAPGRWLRCRAAGADRRRHPYSLR